VVEIYVPKGGWLHEEGSMMSFVAGRIVVARVASGVFRVFLIGTGSRLFAGGKCTAHITITHCIDIYLGSRI